MTVEALSNPMLNRCRTLCAAPPYTPRPHHRVRQLACMARRVLMLVAARKVTPRAQFSFSALRDSSVAVQDPAMTNTELGTGELKPARVPRLTALVKRACDLLARGLAKDITDAALQLNCSREHLSRQLGKSHVQGYLTRTASRKIALAVLRAAHVKVDLLESTSQRVRNDAASDVLAMGGIAPPYQRAGITINNTVAAGYVIKLVHVGDEANTSLPGPPGGQQDGGH
jgi:hypothetical protein